MRHHRGRVEEPLSTSVVLGGESILGLGGEGWGHKRHGEEDCHSSNH